MENILKSRRLNQYASNIRKNIISKLPRFKKGDIVRYYLRKGKFAKEAGLMGPWSKTMYKINQINPAHKFKPMHTYMLEELGKDTPVNDLPPIQESHLKSMHFIQQQNMNTTQLFSNKHFHFLDITKTKQDFPTSKYMAIHQYGNHLGTVNGQYHGKLMLIPLHIFGTRELVQEKFSAIPPDEVVINHTRIGNHRRIGLVPQNLNQTKMNSESTSKYFRSLTL